MCSPDYTNDTNIDTTVDYSCGGDLRWQADTCNISIPGFQGYVKTQNKQQLQSRLLYWEAPLEHAIFVLPGAEENAVVTMKIRINRRRKIRAEKPRTKKCSTVVIGGELGRETWKPTFTTINSRQKQNLDVLFFT